MLPQLVFLLQGGQVLLLQGGQLSLDKLLVQLLSLAFGLGDLCVQSLDGRVIGRYP